MPVNSIKGGGAPMQSKKKLFALCFTLFLLSLAACRHVPYEMITPPDNTPSITQVETAWEDLSHGELAIQHIVFMNDELGRRTSFTYGELEAAYWIMETLLEMGHLEADIEVQYFDAPMGWQVERAYSQNVILTLAGQSEEVIVIGAHYDTFRSYVGASDNASGVGLLLESTQRMRYLHHYYTLIYVFFGAEEVGLLGATYFLESLTPEEQENILFMLNADVLLEGPYLLYITGVYEHGGRRDNDITRSWDVLAEELNTLHDLAFTSYPIGIYRWMSDHIPFFQEGIPVIFLAGFDSTPEGSFGLRVFHSDRDCLHYINENWPGKVEQNMWAFSLFLEEILLRRY